MGQCARKLRAPQWVHPCYRADLLETDQRLYYSFLPRLAQRRMTSASSRKLHGLAGGGDCTKHHLPASSISMASRTGQASAPRQSLPEPGIVRRAQQRPL